MTKKKEEFEKKYQKNYVECLSCKHIFHRPKSQVKDNIFCSIKCKGNGMSNNLTKPMRKGTGQYDKETPLIRRKYYKYKRFDKDKFNQRLDYDINYFIKSIKEGKCFYCDNNKNLGFDRIDNSKGHLLDNIVICCSLCNMTRGDRFSVDEMKLIGDVIKKIREEKEYEI